MSRQPRQVIQRRWYDKHHRGKGVCVDCRRPIHLTSQRCPACNVRGLKGRGHLRRGFEPHPVRALADAEAAWLGAMIEGEGTIYLRQQIGHHTKPHVEIRVGNTEVETIATCLRLAGAGRVHPDPRNGNGRHRPMWYWSLSADSSVCSLLPQIIPYLTGKRERAQEALDRVGR